MRTLRIVLLSLALAFASLIAASPAQSFADVTRLVATLLSSATWSGTLTQNSDGSDIIFNSGADGSVRQSTTDGSDNRCLIFDGGVGNADSRGSRLKVCGNEAGAPGEIRLRTGSGIASNIILDNEGSGAIQLFTNGTLRWTVSNSGGLTNDASGGGNLNFSKAFTGPVLDTSTLAAAGSLQSDAAALAHMVTRVTGADGTKGVKLPALSGFNAGNLFYIINSSTTSALKYYSNAAGETIDGQSGTTANSLGAKLWAICLAYDSSNWYCADSVVPF